MSLHRFGFHCAQAVTLFWLTACAASAPTADSPTAIATGTLNEWALSPPSGCAVGSSGPTLNPRNAIRYARLSAIEALAADSLEVDVQSISGIGPDGTFEIAAQALSGTLVNARVVALWADVDDENGSGRRIRQVYSLACWPDASLRDIPEPPYPIWILEPPTHDGKICATGVAGPTWKSGDQRDSALRDARLALAAALESRIETRIFDDGRGVAKIARQIDPSPSALTRAATAIRLEQDWYDETGSGPIGLPGVLYGRACIED